eukprot:TRINITY_DN827_c0_g3_i3.p1 TRINITY_DN827_c0_g3~~TRINITY_DN827_c0_g3_i3.p1  ORF type:complete len:102 (-),score=10.30 TRINITY_DN827_c0_g3_i3:28-333(-)
MFQLRDDHGNGFIFSPFFRSIVSFFLSFFFFISVFLLTFSSILLLFFHLRQDPLHPIHYAFVPLPKQCEYSINLRIQQAPIFFKGQLCTSASFFHSLPGHK